MFLGEVPSRLGVSLQPRRKLTLYVMAQMSGHKASASGPLSHHQCSIHWLLGESEQRPWGTAGDTHQVSITPDRNVDT